VILTNLNNPSAVAQSTELKEAMTQLCILTDQPAKWMSYANCVDTALAQNSYTNITSANCMRSAKVDADAVSKCVAERGLQLAKNEVATIQQLGLRVTPTIFINNDLYTSRLSYDVLFKTVCMYLSSPPEACSG
jgi:protein-disulfide isomerase